MKKMKISAIALLSFGMLLASCGGNNGSGSVSNSISQGGNSNSTQNSTSESTVVSKKSITWENIPGVTFEAVTEGQQLPVEAELNSQISFVAKIESGYSGTLVVLVNEIEVSAQSNVYSFVLNDDTTVTAMGVYAPLSGTGSKSDPIVIMSGEQLRHISSVVNNQTIDENSEAQYYSIGANIDLKGREFTPIGMGYDNRFLGHIDGKGHTISNFKITTISENQIAFGLFGIVEGSILDLKISNFEIDLDFVATTDNYFGYVGGILGYSYNSFIEGLIATDGQITIDDYTPSTNENYAVAYAGGIVGQLERTDGYYQPVE